MMRFVHETSRMCVTLKKDLMQKKVRKGTGRKERRGEEGKDEKKKEKMKGR